MALNEKDRRWVDGNEVDTVELSPGIERKILAYSDQLMCVEYRMKAGTSVAPHFHQPHTQAGYILSGTFAFVAEGQTKVLRQGDSFLFHPNVAHSCACVEDGMIVDFFTPMREDVL